MVSPRKSNLTPTVGLLSQIDVPIPSPGQSLPDKVQYYVLRADFDGSSFYFWFTKGPVSSGSPDDPPIDISVYTESCTICIQLDSDVSWQLQTSGPAVTLGDEDAKNRYHDLSVRAAAMEAWFGAIQKAGGTLGDFDPFNLYVVLDSGTFGETQPTAIRIDPDIKNPGPPQLGGSPKASRKRKGSPRRKNKRTKRR